MPEADVEGAFLTATPAGAAAVIVEVVLPVHRPVRKVLNYASTALLFPVRKVLVFSRSRKVLNKVQPYSFPYVKSWSKYCIGHSRKPVLSQIQRVYLVLPAAYRAAANARHREVLIFFGSREISGGE